MKKLLMLTAALSLTLAAPAWSQSSQRERTQGTSSTQGRESTQGRTEERSDESTLSSELSGSALLVEAISRLERSNGQGQAADWFRSCRLFSNPNPQQPWMNPNHVPNTRLAADPTAGDMGMVLSRTRLDRARMDEPPILWGFPEIVHVHYAYVPTVYNVGLNGQHTAQLKSMVHCWIGYGTLAEAALSRAPSVAAATPDAARDGAGVLVADFEAGVALMARALADAGEDAAVWGQAKSIAAAIPGCVIPVYGDSSGTGPETATLRCGAYSIEPLSRTAKRGGTPWIGADGVYGRTVAIRTASSARIAATKGTSTTTRTETTTGTTSRQSTTGRGTGSKIPE